MQNGTRAKNKNRVMENITRQQKRRFTRDMKDNKWVVEGWQVMKFDRRQVDIVNKTREVDIYVNDIYHCIVREHPDYTYLSIKRLDILPIHNWRHMQQIKNDICGDEREGIEIYPAMSRIVDTCNQYHLWVFREPINNIGFTERLVKMS